MDWVTIRDGQRKGEVKSGMLKTGRGGQGGSGGQVGMEGEAWRWEVTRWTEHGGGGHRTLHQKDAAGRQPSLQDLRMKLTATRPLRGAGSSAATPLCWGAKITAAERRRGGEGAGSVWGEASGGEHSAPVGSKGPGDTCAGQ